MVESLYRYRSETGVEVPNHVHSEGASLDDSEYADSLLRSWLVSHFSRTHGKYDSETGMIFIDENTSLSKKSVREHELIHKLLDLYGDGNNSQKSEAFTQDYEFDNLDHVDITQDEELADKYNVDPEVTEAVVSDRYENLMAEIGRQRMSENIMRGETGGSIERSAGSRVEEILTHYLSPHSNSESMDFYGFTEQEIRKAKKGIMALDKDCKFNRSELIKRFAEFEDFEDFMEQTQELDPVCNSELDELNGHLRAKHKSLKQLVGETLGF
jgi:hypothetical protein